MKKPFHIGFNIAIIFMLTVLVISIYTAILQMNFSNNMLEAAVKDHTRCSDAIHKLVSNTFTKDDYENITAVGDMSSERYRELQKKLNELRSLNSTRYLYTAKRGDDGRLIYLIDGLDLDADDFAFPGTYIEEEMIPYIDAALSGKTVYSQEIMDTTWGHIFTACYPVMASDGSDEIIGALCMEMDMESTYEYMKKSRDATIKIACTAAAVTIVMIITIYLALHKNKLKDEKQQELIRQSAIAAEAANKAKSTFLFNISHDIRTPMNAIIGYAELAGRITESDNKLNDYLEKIRICGQKMLSLLDNVLELSRIESGKVTIEETAVAAGSIFDDCLIMIHSEAEKKHLTISVEKEMICPYIYFDTSRITEIILNIISNAIKYTGDGGEIRCTIKQLPHQKEGWIYHELSVADNGIGMSEEFQTHIFESFARERSSTVSGIEGTGLGMGIVKKLVDLMDGTIDIKSRLGEGTTVTVRIPCRTASYEDTQPKRAETRNDKNILEGKHILLAEDNDLNSEIAIALLSEKGLIVDRAADGVKCIEMLEKAPDGYYSLILMDIQMPILDGYDTTTTIRRLSDTAKSSIPIIAMTANAFEEDRKKALSVGMNDHVAKPIDMNILIPTLQKYL